MTSELVVVVRGVPAPQGSKRHVGNGRMVEQSPHLKSWRATVSQYAAAARYATRTWPTAEELKGHPIELHCVFTLARPASHWRTGKLAHLLRDSAPTQPGSRPDLDKLLRSTLDALTDAGAIFDDSQVVSISAQKSYPGGHIDALDSPGAVLTLREL